MGWGDHCAVAKCAPRVRPLPSSHSQWGGCQLHYLRCLHDPRQGDYPGSQVCCTQGKRSPNPGAQTLYLSHTLGGIASQGKTLGVRDTQSHTKIYVGCYKYSDSPHCGGCSHTERGMETYHCHRHSPTQSQNRPVLRHNHRQCLILSLTYQWWGTSTHIQVTDTHQQLDTTTHVEFHDI